jgi:hypothetical protein
MLRNSQLGTMGTSLMVESLKFSIPGIQIPLKRIRYSLKNKSNGHSSEGFSQKVQPEGWNPGVGGLRLIVSKTSGLA